MFPVITLVGWRESMMTKRFIAVCLLLIVLLVPLLVSACVSDNIKASLGKEFTLPAGKTAVISGENFSIKFEKVTGDSRCPSDVVCIWAGEAKCDTVFTYKGNDYPVTLTAGGGNPDNYAFENYKVYFDLQPYPVSTQQIAPGDYRLILTVTKK
jgi:hypothetical protein